MNKLKYTVFFILERERNIEIFKKNTYLVYRYTNSFVIQISIGMSHGAAYRIDNFVELGTPKPNVIQILKLWKHSCDRSENPRFE